MSIIGGRGQSMQVHAFMPFHTYPPGKMKANDRLLGQTSPWIACIHTWNTSCHSVFLRSSCGVTILRCFSVPVNHVHELLKVHKNSLCWPKCPTKCCNHRQMSAPENPFSVCQAVDMFLRVDLTQFVRRCESVSRTWILALRESAAWITSVVHINSSLSLCNSHLSGEDTGSFWAPKVTFELVCRCGGGGGGEAPRKKNFVVS